MMVRADGLGHFTSRSDWALKGHNSSGSNITFSPTGGRGSRGGVSIASNSNIHTVLPSAVTTIFAHFAFNSSVRFNTCQFAGFRSATNDHVLVEGLEDGSIRVSRSDSLLGQTAFSTSSLTTLGTSAPGVYFAGVWHQAQIKCKIASGTSGEVTIKIDGVQILSLTGINTYAGDGAVTVSQVGHGTNFGIGTIAYADICHVDTTDDGSGYTTYLGDVAVYEEVDPIDGDELQWTRSTGAGTWSSHVDSNPQNGDAEYISSAANGNRNCFSFPNVDTTIGTILAIKATFCHRKEDPNYGAVKLYSRSDDNVDHDGDAQVCTESYHFTERIFPFDLKDNTSWTTTKVDNTQLGVVNVS